MLHFHVNSLTPRLSSGQSIGRATSGFYEKPAIFMPSTPGECYVMALVYYNNLWKMPCISLNETKKFKLECNKKGTIILRVLIYR
jgi:hypothetical protein